MYRRAYELLENFLICMVRFCTSTNRSVITKLYLIFLKKIYLPNSQKKYKLLEINALTEVCEIRIVGSLFILSIRASEIMGSPQFLSRLSSIDACKIGKCYGKYFRQKSSIKKIKNIAYTLSDKQGKYKILSLSREGNIEYVEKSTQKIHVEKLINIIENRALIKNFDPSQAAYLGFLAGLRTEDENNPSLKKCRNKKNLLKKMKMKPRLYIVE